MKNCWQNTLLCYRSRDLFAEDNFFPSFIHLEAFHQNICRFTQNIAEYLTAVY